MIYLGNGIYSDSGPDVLAHGREWKTHKYIAIKNGRYIYPEDVKKSSDGNSALSDDAKRTMRVGVRVAKNDLVYGPDNPYGKTTGGLKGLAFKKDIRRGLEDNTKNQIAIGARKGDNIARTGKPTKLAPGRPGADRREDRNLKSKTDRLAKAGAKVFKSEMDKAFANKRSKDASATKEYLLKKKKAIAKGTNTMAEQAEKVKNKKTYEKSVERYKTKKRLIESNKPHNWNR